MHELELRNMDLIQISRIIMIPSFPKCGKEGKSQMKKNWKRLFKMFHNPSLQEVKELLK